MRDHRAQAARPLGCRLDPNGGLIRQEATIRAQPARADAESTLNPPLAHS